MRVRYTPAALSHLNEIGEYIAKDDPVAARRVIQAIRHTVDLLRDNPDMGRRGPLGGTREIIIPRLLCRLSGERHRHRGVRCHPYSPAMAGKPDMTGWGSQLVIRRLDPAMSRACLVCLLAIAPWLSGCAVVAVADTAVTVAATTVRIGASVVETTVDVTLAGVKAVAGVGDDKQEAGK
jgi:plasmid stabilization system protein ParE